ncbi:MAG: hypothetical protein FJ265_14580 [Planctomycetes bacterium]|nr:hypothetical protein [Planctomycetota bacterium]
MQDRTRHDFSGSLPPLPFPFPQRRDLARFRDTVLAWFRRRNRPVRFGPDLVATEPNGLQHGLVNLAQECSLAPAAAWPAIVGNRLGLSDPRRLQRTVQHAAEAPFADLAPRLFVRIYPAGHLPEAHLDQFVHRVDLEGTVTALVLDIGPSMLTVPRPFVAPWGQDDAALFARALQNVAALPAEWETSTLPGPAGAVLDHLCGDDFASSRALCPGALPRYGRHGNLLALGKRGLLSSWAIDAMADTLPIEGMALLAAAGFRTGPGSITPHLYWRAPDGRFERQQTSVDQHHVQVAPSPGFAAVWRELLPEPA